MVGDDVTNDVAGALAVGMPAAWIDRSQPQDRQSKKESPQGATCIRSLQDLLGLVPGNTASGRLTEGADESHVC